MFSTINNLTIPVLNALAIGTIVLVSYLYLKRNRSESPWPKVPGALPFIGNAIGGTDNFLRRLEEWAAEYGQEKGVFEFKLFGVRYICLCNEKNAALAERERPYKMTRNRNVNRAVNK